MHSELNSFLTKMSKESKFNVSLGESGGYVEFGNSSGKSFILALSSLCTTILDILDHLDKFTGHSKYVEKEWRDLGAEYFTNASVNTMSTVQTKPLFTTLGKLINWANPENIPENPDLVINLSKESLNTTIKRLNQVIEEYTPDKERETKKSYVELVCEKKINVFAKKVLFYLQNYDNLDKVLPYLKDLNEHGNASINYKKRNLTSIFKISETELSHSELSSGGRPRNYPDALTIDGIKGYIYISTEWTGSEKESRLHLEDFMFIISDLYSEFYFVTDEDRYCLVKDIDMEEENIFKVNTKVNGSLTFRYKNILLKGVPGTGKSHLIDKIITDKDKLALEKNDNNILRINIHSASSNADLMQGIGIATKKDQIIYSEKQGLILNHIRKAITSPKQPFAIVLEEIQENSLNELIGDLVYLIENSKRTDLSTEPSQDFSNMESFIEDYIKNNPNTYYVEMPYLVSTETRYRKMILPNNLYVFCTSNYRDDKKVIEDNLLRRFEVIEIYPAYKETIGNDFKSKDVSDFLKKLNEEIVKHFHENGEIHPDRFIIGHAIWLDVENIVEFYAKLLKVVTEFKDIKELDFNSDLKPILASIDNYPFEIKKNEFQKNNYKDLIEYLQNKCYSDLFGNSQEQAEVKIRTPDYSKNEVATADTKVDLEEETNKDGANTDQLD